MRAGACGGGGGGGGRVLPPPRAAKLIFEIKKDFLRTTDFILLRKMKEISINTGF
jgi:hypothetical protein